jgi:hypothetical protein
MASRSAVGRIRSCANLAAVQRRAYNNTWRIDVATYHLERQIPLEEGYDLVVAGGGPAGVAAAISASRLGGRVLLLEATGCLGGMATSGLVTAFDPMSDGHRMLVQGLMREIVETLYARGGLDPDATPAFWQSKYMTWTPFHPEALKRLLDELVVKAGVEIRFFTRLMDADVDRGRHSVNGVILHNVEGYRYVAAKTFIDATGDAILADLCGVTCRQAGRDTPGIMPATLTSLFAGIDFARFDRKSQRANLPRAIQDGHFTQPDRHLPGMSRIGQTLGYLNGGHVFHLDALRCKDLTDGMILGRKIAVEYTEYYRKYVPGCEKIEHVTTAALMGTRESRRIVGEYELCLADYLARRQFPDQIGVFNKYVDIHPLDTSTAEWERFQQEHQQLNLHPGECYGLPYGMLVPKHWTNLWVAGRCASSDVAVHGSVRVQPAAAMMGQAAGTAAEQCIRTGQPACDLDTAELVKTLRDNGAYLPQETIQRQMTRQVPQ